MTVLWTLLCIPIAVEVTAALLDFRDYLRTPGLRARAIDRLVLPMLLLAAVLWLAVPSHLTAVLIAFAIVIVWQILLNVVARAVVGRDAFASQSIDTDEPIIE